MLAGRYRLEKVLGEGGMGRVHLARDTRLADKPVAIKELICSGPADESWELATTLFLREGRILATLDHVGLVHVSDCFRDGDSAWLVMEYVTGETLAQAVTRTGQPISADQAVAWTREICSILAYVHHHDPPVIIRDLKPANIMQESSGRLRLIDFGLARFMRPGGSVTAMGATMGTQGFAPVEQYGEEGTDPRADIYALGATLYSLLTLEIPPPSVIRGFGTDPLRRPRDLKPEIPEGLEQIILKMMAVRREDRFPSVEAVVEALDRPSPGRPSRGKSRLPVAVAGLMGLLLLGLGWRVARPAASHDPELLTLRMPVAMSSPSYTWMASFIDGDTRLVTGSDNENHYQIWNVTDGTLSESRAGRPYLLSPGGKYLYSGFHSVYLTLEDFTTHQVVKDTTAAACVNAACFSPDGATLLTGGFQCPIVLWNAATGETRQQWENASLTSAAWSPDGQVVATGDSDGNLTLWDPTRGQVLHKLSQGARAIDALAWSPDSHTLMSGDDAGQLRVWDRDGTPGRTLQQIGPVVRSLAWSPLGSELASGQETGAIRLYRTADWSVRYESPAVKTEARAAVNVLTWSHDGRRLAAGRWDGAILMWRVH